MVCAFLFVMGCVVWFGDLYGCCHGRLCVSIVYVACVSRGYLVVFYCCHHFVACFVFIVGCVFPGVTHVSLGHGFREFAEGYICGALRSLTNLRMSGLCCCR